MSNHNAAATFIGGKTFIMKHILSSLLALGASLGLSAQTQVTIPLDLIEAECYPVGWQSENGGAFSDFNRDTYDCKVYDYNLQPVFSFAGGNSTRLAEIYTEDFSNVGSVPHQDQKCFFSQTLFNDDDAYEYIVVEDYDEDDQSGKSLRIMTSASSTPLAVLEPGFSIWEEVSVIYFGQGKPFYLIAIGDDDFQCYKWDRANSSVQKITTEINPMVFASPNPVKAGDVVSLKVNDNCDSYDIAVFSMRGRFTKKLSSSDATLDTTGLAPGHYIYKVTSEGRKIGTGKLIVR